MAIPNEVEDKLEDNSSYVVQHEDIVRLMEETTKEKPWSRYMIQQQLDADPSKKTVKDRLDELVELEVLDSYEYHNVTLYDLAYDPIVTDGGGLRDASLIDVATLRDRNSVRDLGAGLFITSLAIFGYGVVAERTTLTTDITLTGNYFLDTGMILYTFAGVIFILILMSEMVERFLSKRELLG